MTKEEAMKVAKKMRQWLLNDREKEALETLIPELRESEDERIRNSLYTFFQGMLERNEDCYKVGGFVKFEGIDVKSILAWLEKQKYDRMKPIYDARESFESALEKAWNDYHNGYENVDKLEDDYVECAHAKGFREGYLFGIEKQKEQKPADYCSVRDEFDLDGNLKQKPVEIVNYPSDVIEACMLRYLQSAANRKDDIEIVEDTKAFKKELIDIVKQIEKPVEWSEEEKGILLECISVLQNSSHWVLADKLSSLRPQPKQEWSKEDENKIERLAFLVSIAAEKEMISPEECIDLRNFVKSYRPRPFWKPSEDEKRLINTSISFLKDFADKGYENAVECIDWLKSKLNGNSDK